jgi:hypothetical protein
MHVLEWDLQIAQDYDLLHLVLVVVLIGDIVDAIRQVRNYPIRKCLAVCKNPEGMRLCESCFA